MRCPRCHDEYEPHVSWCGTCNVALVAEGAEAPPPVPDAHLGRFHPAVAEHLGGMLDERGIPYETLTRDGAVELVVPRDQRDGLRTEVSMDWPDIVAALPEESVGDVRWQGGPYPGWVDPPLGGWVDRDGHIVVDVDSDDTEQVRTVGPVLAVAGAALLVLTWWADLGAGGGFAGVGLLILGLLLPR